MEVFSPPRVTAMAERRRSAPRRRAGLAPGPGWRVLGLLFARGPRAGDQACDLPVAVPLDWQPTVRRLAWSQRRREPPEDGQAGGRQARGGGQGPPGVHGEALPAPAGEGRPLPARAPGLGNFAAGSLHGAPAKRDGS
eukprot:2290661-Alexandrium_andersonii.AAC.1